MDALYTIYIYHGGFTWICGIPWSIFIIFVIYVCMYIRVRRSFLFSSTDFIKFLFVGHSIALGQGILKLFFSESYLTRIIQYQSSCSLVVKINKYFFKYSRVKYQRQAFSKTFKTLTHCSTGKIKTVFFFLHIYIYSEFYSFLLPVQPIFKIN